MKINLIDTKEKDDTLLKSRIQQAKIQLNNIIFQIQQQSTMKQQQQQQQQQYQYSNSFDQVLIVDVVEGVLIDCANQIAYIQKKQIFDTENIIKIQNLLEMAIKQLQSLKQFSQNILDLEIVLDDIVKINKYKINQFDKKTGYQKQIQVVEIELQPFSFFQNPNQNEQDLKKLAIQKYQFETEIQNLFQKLKNDTKLVNPLTLVINQNIEASNPEVLFYVLSDQMRQAGRVFRKSLLYDEKLMYSFHGQFVVDSNDSQACTLQLQETQNLTYEAIVSDEQVKQEFINQCRIGLSIDLKVPESQIHIIAIKEGSIKVIFEIQDATGVDLQSENLEEISRLLPGTSPKLILHQYFKKAALSKNDFNPKYNMTWDHHKFGQCDNRGPKNKPQPYFFPVGWKGYALNVSGRYGENDNWLAMNGNDEMVCYVSWDQFQWMQFNPGDRQKFYDKKCLLTNKVIGNGVYFSNHIEVCEQYSIQQIKYSSQPTQIMDKKFIVAFQSRVRPEALRQCRKSADLALIQKIAEHKKDNPSYNKSLDNMDLWNNDYFVVNHTCDIRPYRILLKQVKEIQNQQRYNMCGIY